MYACFSSPSFKSIFLWFTRMSLLPPQLYAATVLSTWPKFPYQCWDISVDFSWAPSVLPSSKGKASSLLGLSVYSFWPWLRLFTFLLLSWPNIAIQSRWALGMGSWSLLLILVLAMVLISEGGPQSWHTTWYWRICYHVNKNHVQNITR